MESIAERIKTRRQVDPIARPAKPVNMERQESHQNLYWAWEKDLEITEEESGYCLPSSLRCASPEIIGEPPVKPSVSFQMKNLMKEQENKQQVERWYANGSMVPNTEYLQVVLRSPFATMPTQGSTFSAGYDLYSPKDMVIPAGSMKIIDLEIGIKLPFGTYGRIASRSGMASKGVVAVGGVIDRDYTGNIMVLLHNTNNYAYSVKKNDRIAQMVVEVHRMPMVIKVDSINETPRGNGGIGSTGK